VSNGHRYSMTKLQLIKLARNSGAVFLLPRSSRVHRAELNDR
jgi:hypothetical protein